MKHIIALLFVVGLVFTGCSTVQPNKLGMAYTPATQSVPTEPLKIKKMTPISYEYDVNWQGCSEIKFLKKFVGKVTKSDSGEKIRVDNIIDIHAHSYSIQKGFSIFRGANKFKCSFWGYAVEYEK